MNKTILFFLALVLAATTACGRGSSNNNPVKEETMATEGNCDVNPFGVIATQVAYNEGEEWLNQLIKYLQANFLYMQEFCREHLPEFPITVLEGTYLVWMDCHRLGIHSQELEQRLVNEAGLWLNAGTMYGTEGKGFMRWNIACPRTTVAEGLKRFTGFVRNL